MTDSRTPEPRTPRFPHARLPPCVRRRVPCLHGVRGRHRTGRFPRTGRKALDSLIRHSTDNAVSWITLDRPEAMNALTWDQRERVIALLAEASADPEVRAVVITATGRGFCAGADLRGGPPSGARVAGDVARTIRLGAQR